MNTKTASVEIIPSGPACGAEIQGINIANVLNDSTFKLIESALHDHGVIIFRDQNITEANHIAFTKRFGKIEKNNTAKYYAHPDYPDEILIVSNKKENGKYVGNPNSGHTWHTDQSYSKRPPRATVLNALEVPMKDGKPLGDTLFANTATVYNALPTNLKKRLEGLKAIHSFSARKHSSNADKQTNAKPKDSHPEVLHPIVRTHPFSGQKCLYVSEGECIGIANMPEQEALPLIKELSDHIIKPEFIYRHHWQKGDLVMWDNCVVHHRAIKDYGPDDLRYVHRTLVMGTEPF